MSKVVLFALAASAGMAAGASADVVTQWNFNSAVADANTATGSTGPSTGAGSLATLGGVTQVFASGDSNGGSSDPASGDDSGYQTTGYPAAGAGNETAGIQAMASTLGFQDITISWDQRHSNTSSRYWAFYYTLDGTNWTRLSLDMTNAGLGGNVNSAFGPNGTFAGPLGDTWFNGRSVSLADIPGADNNANFGFRVVSSFGDGAAYSASSPTGSYSASGTSRFDMLTISGSQLPTPGAIALLGLGGLMAARRKR